MNLVVERLLCSRRGKQRKTGGIQHRQQRRGKRLHHPVKQNVTIAAP